MKIAHMSYVSDYKPRQYSMSFPDHYTEIEVYEALEEWLRQQSWAFDKEYELILPDLENLRLRAATRLNWEQVVEEFFKIVSKEEFWDLWYIQVHCWTPSKTTHEIF